jgi:4-amino-4-deoxy-L-arabinose transferase-like glycosyltransferase
LLLIGVLLLAVVVRVAFAAATTSWVFPDRWNYAFEMGQIGASIAEGHGFSSPGPPPRPTAWMPPLYPYLIAGVFALFGTYSIASALILEALQVALAGLTCLVLYRLGKAAFDAHVGLLAAGLLAVYPASLHFSVQKIWSTTAAALALLVVLWLFLRTRDRPTLVAGVVLGIALGLATLLEPPILGIAPFAFVWLFVDAQGTRRRIIALAIVAVSCVLVTVSPWAVRNYRVFGHVILTKSNFGHELYLTNNPYSEIGNTPLSESIEHQLRGKAPTPLLTEAERQYVLRADEADKNRLYRRKGMDYISAHPRRFAQLTLQRIRLFWVNTEKMRSAGEEVAGLVYLAIFVSGVVGLVLSKLRRRELQLFALTLVVFPLPYYVTNVQHWRYRYPLEPLLMLFAAFAAVSVLRRSRAAADSNGAPVDPEG